jgi:hypothetical protein
VNISLIDLKYENAVFMLAYLTDAQEHFRDERNIRRAREALEDFSRAMNEDCERRASAKYIARLRDSLTCDSG